MGGLRATLYVMISIGKPPAETMALSLSTVPSTKKWILNLPEIVRSVEVTRRDEYTEAYISHSTADVVIRSQWIGNDCYDVLIEIFPDSCARRTRRGAYVEFTTTGTWVDQWLSNALSKVN